MQKIVGMACTSWSATQKRKTTLTVSSAKLKSAVDKDARTR